MRFFDLLSLILENLSRRKGRVALTAIGVVIGTAAVVILVSLATGLQRSATSNLWGIGDLTQIQVNPNYGEGPVMMEKASVARGGGGGGGGGSSQSSVKLLTATTIEELKTIPGVRAVVPRDYMQVGSMMKLGNLEGGANIIGIGLSDLSALDYKAEWGTTALAKGTAVVGALVVRNFYDPRFRPGQPTPEPPDLKDATLKLSLIKWVQDGQNGYEVRKTYQVRVTGILSESRGESDYSIYMPIEDVTTFNEWGTGRRINRQRDGYNMMIVKVDDPQQVLDIADQITALGYQASTPQTYVEGINSFFTILQVVFGGIGAISLLVAAIGIANTMAMAILERTREIGLMKAVGATNNNVLGVFLGEASGIGFIGGLGGMLLGWGAGKVVNVIAISYFASQASSGGAPPPSTIAYTPAWLPVFAVIFATLVGLLSGLYPALRAATLVPVTALKYE